MKVHRGSTLARTAREITGSFPRSRPAPSAPRTQSVFSEAVRGASDAPPGELAEALGRTLYLAHLAVILFWVLDRTGRQSATRELVALAERLLGPMALALRFRRARAGLLRLDAVIRAALLDAG